MRIEKVLSFSNGEQFDVDGVYYQNFERIVYSCNIFCTKLRIVYSRHSVDI